MAFRTSNTITFTEQKKIVEIKEWYLATSKGENVTIDDIGWTTGIQKADAQKKYLWNYEEVIYSIGESEKSLPVIIGTYGSISGIVNYYQVTQTANIPELPKGDELNGWETDFSKITLSSINKYLWNFEVIIYADGSAKSSDPAIIGVYGDSGEDAISFKIYSTDGLEFIDDIDEQKRVDTINLKLSVYKGNKPLSENITFTWYWYGEIIEYILDETVTSDTTGEYYILDSDEYIAKTLPTEYDPTMQYYISTSRYDYQVIDGYENTTSTILPVNINDKYAFADLKCEMIYNDDPEPYVDHRMLKKRMDTFSAIIKFFGGTNVFAQGEDYIIGYIELYKNNKVEETVITTSYYPDVITLDNSTGEIKKYVIDDSVSNVTEGIYYVIENGKYISKNLPDSFEENTIYYQIEIIPHENENDLSYFIYNDNNNYKVILGKYDNIKNQWINVEYLDNADDYSTKYVYSNIINDNIKSNIFVISKNNVTRTEDIDIDVFTAYKDEEKYIPDDTVTSETVGTYWIMNSENGDYELKTLPNDYVEGTEYCNLIISKTPNDDTFVATAQAVIIDLNDTVVSDIEPANPQIGQTWLDNINNVLKICTGFDENNNAIWQLSSKQQKGKSIYTEKPSEYETGDLWVVEAPGYYYETSVSEGDEGVYWVFNEKTSRYDMVKLPEAYTNEQKYYIGFQEGGIFQAFEDSNSTGFNYLHWKDAMSSITQIVNNVSQYMVFDSSSGLKIGQKDDLFYVNIDSKEMGFYDNSDKDKGVSAVKVVSIGSQSANIKNMSVEDSAIFKCEETAFNTSINFAIKETDSNGNDEYIDKFKFQIEENGSLSLVIV